MEKLRLAPKIEYADKKIMQCFSFYYFFDLFGVLCKNQKVY